MVEYDFSRAVALETGESCAVSPFDDAEIVDRDVLRSNLRGGTGKSLYAGNTELLLLKGKRLALCTESGILICPVLRGPELSGGVSSNQSSIVVRGTEKNQYLKIEGTPSVIRHWIPIIQTIFENGSAEEPPSKYFEGLGISLSTESLIPCSNTTTALNTAGSRMSVTTGFASEVSNLLNFNPALDLLVPSVPWKSPSGDITPSPNSLYLSGSEETPDESAREPNQSEGAPQSTPQRESKSERAPPTVMPPIPKPTEVPEVHFMSHDFEKPKIPAAVDYAPATPTSLNSGNSANSQRKLQVKVRKSFQTMMKRLRKPRPSKHAMALSKADESEEMGRDKHVQGSHGVPSPALSENSKESYDDSIKSPTEKHQRTGSANREPEKAQEEEEEGKEKEDDVPGECSDISEIRESRAPSQLPSSDHWTDIDLDDKGVELPIDLSSKGQSNPTISNGFNLSDQFGSSGSSFITASESGSVKAVSFESHNRTVEIGASRFSSQSSGLSSALSYRSHRSQKSYASKASSSLEPLPEADEVPELIADTSADSQFSDFLASVRSKAKAMEQQKEAEEAEKRRLARTRNREEQATAAVIAYENAKAVASAPSLEPPALVVDSPAPPPAIPQPVPVPRQVAAPSEEYPTLDPRKLESLPSQGRQRLTEVSLNASAPALNIQGPSMNSLFNGAMWVSRWTLDRWTPLSQLELEVQVTATDRSSSRIFVVGHRGMGPTIFKFGRRSGVRRVGAHDIEVRITDDEIYMFRARDPERARQFFASLAALQSEVRDQNSMSTMSRYSADRNSVFSARPRDSVYSARPKDSVYTTRPRDSFYSMRPRDSVYSAHPRDSVYSARPRDSVYSARPRDSVYPARSESVDSFEMWRRKVAPPPLAKPRFLRSAIIEE